jgi:DnaJ-class molecular chaperone
MNKPSGSEFIEEPCPRCDGSGVIKDGAPSVRVGNLPKTMARNCPQCRGLGRIRKRRPDESSVRSN